MNNFELIKVVRARKPLWDKSTWSKVDVFAREELWNEVAEKVDLPKDIIKTRWKNLRDTYRKLLRKMCADNACEEPRWPYFQAMSFLKEMTLRIKPKNTDITLRRNEPFEADYSLTLLSSSQDDDDTIDPLSFTQKLQQSQYLETAPSRGTKRQIEEEPSDDILELGNCETQDVARSVLTVPRVRMQDDDDYQFLQSLYPHLKQVPKKRKLMLRMRMEQLIYDELYATSSSSTQTSTLLDSNAKLGL